LASGRAALLRPLFSASNCTIFDDSQGHKLAVHKASSVEPTRWYGNRERRNTKGRRTYVARMHDLIHVRIVRS
jgi:hypothetical protein